MSHEQRARSPDTSPGGLRVLAGRFPEAVLDNPALPLLALTQPAEWSDIVGRARAELASRRLRALLVESSVEAPRGWQRAVVRHVAPLCDEATRRRVEGLLDALDAGADRERASALRGELLAWLSDGPVDEQAPAMMVVTAVLHLLADQGALAADACVEAARREAEGRGGSAWMARAIEMEWQVSELAAMLGH